MSHNVVVAIFELIMTEDASKTGPVASCLPDAFADGMPIPTYAYACTMVRGIAATTAPLMQLSRLSTPSSR